MHSGNTDGQHPHTACSNLVIDTLENILAPGGRARLSPYVEETQIRVLFDQSVDAANRYRSISAILNQNQNKVRSLAKVWAQFCSSGKHFSADIYSEDFLTTYLIYYFSVNVAKLQINLLDLLREKELLNEAWHVVDVGVGAGTTIIAVADFLLAWKTICDLYEVQFPVKEVQFSGLDKRPEALYFARRVAREFSTSIGSRECISNDFVSNLCTALDAASWLEFDLEGGDIIPDIFTPNLLVASNVLNELSSNGAEQLKRLITNLPRGCLALIIEPGDCQRAKNLMAWRKNILKSGRFTNWGPCTTGISEQSFCEDCWNARRHSFHQPLLYRKFRETAKEFLPNQKSFDEYENDLLSWSTAWVKRGDHVPQEFSPKFVKPNEPLPEDYPLQYIGHYCERVNDTTFGPVEFDPDDFPAKKNGTWKEHIKFCPSIVAGKGLTFIRKPGFQLPKLYYGDRVKITHGQIVKYIEKRGIFELKLDPQSKLIPLKEQKRPKNVFLKSYSKNAQNAVDEIAYRLFGFQNMRPFQHRILEQALTGRSILGIAATGSGKSECFILPAMLLPGLTVVVSPLISLMMDQYEQRICDRYGLNHLVTYINSEVEFIEREARLRRMELGYYKLVYFTPEQLERGYVLDSLRRANENIGVRFLAMDEAHCISQWGHDFRPSYLNLSRRFTSYGLNPVRIALTATASPFVRKDICEELGLNPSMLEDGGDVFVETSNRPELNLIVRVKPSTEEKVEDILYELQQFLNKNRHDQLPGAAIVFMPHTGGNPENPERTQGSANVGKFSAGVTPFAAYLERALQQHVSIYHGKMEMDLSENSSEDNQFRPFGDMTNRSRRTEQQRFISGQTQIMVATKGFGMGIDKDNIRLIIHRTPPLNLEAYAQEAGRAGRDGSQADVILYYSPDSSEDETTFGSKFLSPSDFSIQEFFLREKYIRRCDVIAMRAFLRSLTVNAAGSIYFTNDQAIEFLDTCAIQPQIAGLEARYSWPEFPSREPSGYESDEHAEILENGHLYQQKTRYINRILQALYRIRPTIEDHRRLAFLENVQETGAEIVGGRVINSIAIVESNAYFGEALRSAGFDANEFSRFVEEGSLFALSERLGWFIHETADLLRDIKFADGRFQDKKWIPRLLDFKVIAAPKLGPAANKHTLQEWRAYAGARSRASAFEAKRRAAQNQWALKGCNDNKTQKVVQERNPTLDDWFSWKEMNYSVGWEVIPGTAFSDQIDFDKYLTAFMSLHNQREANDWASFQRLLSDYVGVNEDGSLKDNRRNTNCLRAVLLGYLETYEVVVGDNCYSCSRCVPDGDFDRYSLETRKAAVVRMSPKAIEQFDQLKTMAGRFPSAQETQDLFSTIKANERAGRSLRSYFSGWSARLLDQNPYHKAAMWLRFEGMAHEITQFQVKEFLHSAEQILSLLSPDEYQRFESVLNLVKKRLNENVAFHQLLADFYRRWQNSEREAIALNYIIESLPQQGGNTQSLIYTSATRLTELYQSGAPLEDERKYKIYATLAARTAPNWLTSLNGYRRVASGWNWKQVLQEMKKQGSFQSAHELNNALVCAWAESDFSARKEQALKWLLKNPEAVLTWPESLRGQMLQHIPFSVIMKSSTLRLQWQREIQDRRQACQLCLKLLVQGEALSDEEMEQLVVDLEAQLFSAISNLSDYLTEAQQRCQVVIKLAPFITQRELESEARWIEYLLEQEGIDLETVKPIILHFIHHTSHATNCDIFISKIQRIILPLYLDSDISQHIAAHWQPVYLRSPNLLFELLTRISENDNPDCIALSDSLLAEVTKPNTWKVLLKLPKDLPIEKWTHIRIFAEKLFSFTSLAFADQPDIRFHLRGEDIRLLCDLFDWKHDLEEADMLAITLMEITKLTNPFWLTPRAKLVEVLIRAGRFQIAREYSQNNPDLRIYSNGVPLSLEKFIRLIGAPKRETPIFNGYIILAESVFSSLKSSPRR